MKRSRETWLSIGLVALLIVVTVYAALKKGAATIPYLSTSSDPSGALALKLWMQDLGFAPIEPLQSDFLPPANADVIFILEPLYELTTSDFKFLDDWVKTGGTLVVAGGGQGAYYAFQHYEFFLNFLSTPGPFQLSTPLLLAPAPIDPIDLHADWFLSTARTDFATHLAAPEGPLVVSFKQGKGHVILSVSAYIFSNRGLKTDANARLVLNLIGLADQTKSVWFDEWHHGIRTNSVVGPEQWLRHTPAGHGVLFAVVALFLVLLIQGRGFGRPLPLAHELRRRGPLEHVNAISNLNRKAGHRASVLQRYRHDVKRYLGKRYRLDPSLPDDEYVKQLVAFNPALDGEALLYLLTNLNSVKVNEAEMVRLAEDASRWMEQGN